MKARENTAGRVVGCALAFGALAGGMMLSGGGRRGGPDEEGRPDDPRFRAVFENTAVGLAILDVEGRLVRSNPALCEMLGYAEAELRGMTLGDLVHPEDAADDRAVLVELAGGGRDHFQVERRYARRDGGFFWGHVTVSPLREAAPPSAVVAIKDITRRKLAEEALKESEERFRTLVENAADAFFVHDFEGRILDVNRRACESLGYDREELLSMRVTDVGMDFSPEDMAGLWDRVVPGGPVTVEGTHRRKDGTTFPVEVRVGRFETGGRRLMLALARDVTGRKKAEAALQESERRFRQLFENFTDALFIHDERGRFVDCNREACRVLGYEREELLGLSVGDVTVRVLSDEERRAREGDTLWERVMRSEPGSIVGFDRNELRRKDGTTFPVEVGVGAIDYEGRRMIFAAARDISERKALEEQLTHQAFHDPLTGLPNRALFMDRLEHALELESRRGDSLAVLFLDLDDFKNVNDTLGHDVGDQVLVEVGRRLASCVRAADTVARLAGDEFTILLEHISESKDAISVANRIEEGIRVPFRIDGRELSLSASVGIVPEVFAGADPRKLLRAADAAMYEAKRKGKGRYEVHAPGTAASGDG